MYQPTSSICWRKSSYGRTLSCREKSFLFFRHACNNRIERFYLVFLRSQVHNLHKGIPTPKKKEPVTPAFQVADHHCGRQSLIKLLNPLILISGSRHTIRDCQNQSLNRDTLRGYLTRQIGNLVCSAQEFQQPDFDNASVEEAGWNPRLVE